MCKEQVEIVDFSFKGLPGFHKMVLAVWFKYTLTRTHAVSFPQQHILTPPSSSAGPHTAIR
jgi:hypothetical protein